LVFVTSSDLVLGYPLLSAAHDAYLGGKGSQFVWLQRLRFRCHEPALLALLALLVRYSVCLEFCEPFPPRGDGTGEVMERGCRLI
jgi:hypothetical protein